MVCKLADRQSVYHPCVDDLRVQKGLATRERLVAVAGSLFGAYGYEGTSIEAILEAAGLKRGALYHHFDSKKALFDAALDRAIARIADVVAAAARRAGPDPVAALRAGCTAWLELAMDPAIQRVVLLDPPSVVGWDRLRALDETHTLGGLRRNFELIAKQGRVPAGDTNLLAHMLLASLTELALHVARADDQPAALASATSALDLLLSRLLADGTTSGK
jgi:AcrR family transcriptional regulator